MGNLYNMKRGVGDDSKKEITFSHVLGTAATKYFVVPYDCKLVKVYSCINGGLTTADETITFYNGAGTAVTGGVITITQSGGAAGDIDYCTPTANNTFTAGQYCKFVVGGENGTATTAYITCVFELKV